MADASLAVVVGANIAKFSQGMNTVQKTINSVFSVAILKEYVSFAGDVLGGFAVKAVKIAGNYQQASIAFERLLGDHELARKYTDELTDFAYSTPFDYDAIMKDAQALYQVGFAAKDVIPTLRACSDAAAGIGKGQAEIDQMVKSLVHMQSVGEADTRAFESINKVGIPAWKMLATAMNVIEQAAKDAVEKHMISAKDATRILVDGMNDLYKGMMKIQETKTFDGAMANLKGNVEHTMLEIGRIIADGSGIIPAINKTSDAFDLFAKKVRDESVLAAMNAVFGPEMTGLITGTGTVIIGFSTVALGLLIKQLGAAALAATGLKLSLLGVSAAAISALGAITALVAYKASQGIDGFDAEAAADGLSDDDTSAVKNAQKQIKEAEARKKAIKAMQDYQDARDKSAEAERKAKEEAKKIVGGVVSGGSKGGGGGGKDIARQQALQLSKTIEDEYLRTFSTKSKQIEKWYFEESAELEKSRAANENYERDKQRLVELYGQKRLMALQEEARQRNRVEHQISGAWHGSLELRAVFSSDASQRELVRIKNNHENAVEEIQKKWQDLTNEFIGLNQEDRNHFIKTLQEKSIAFETNADGIVTFNKQIQADIAAENKNYADEIVAYHTQCKDILANIDDAYHKNSLIALKDALNEENTERLNSFDTQQNAMRRYYENWLETHKTTHDRVTDIILNSQGSFQSFFKDVLSGAKSFNRSLLDLLNNLLDEIVASIAKTMASQVVNQFLSTLFPLGGGAGGSGRELGGFNTHAAAAGVMGIKLGEFAAGGMVRGVGSNTSDSIPAWLSTGEFVMSAEAVNRIGIPFLNALNNGGISAYSKGGTVGGSVGVTNAMHNTERLGPIKIEIINATGQNVQAKQVDQRFNGKETLITLIMEAGHTNYLGFGDFMKGMANT